ncbi:MAG: hypothetical protein ACREMQ_03770, partial [Longimicrobiales bacterium]
GMVEDGAGNVWVSDGLGRVIARVSEDGSRIAIAAREGRGPGEVLSPTLLARTPDDGVAVYDLGLNAVNVWRRDGTFDHAVQVEMLVYNPKGFGVARSGEFVMSGGVLSNELALHRFSAAGRHLVSWHPAPATENPRAARLLAGGALTVLANDAIVFSDGAAHRIVWFTPDRVPRVIAENPNVAPTMGDNFTWVEGTAPNIVRKFDWYYRRSHGIAVLQNGAILNVVVDRKNAESVWEVYTPSGQLVARSTIRRAYHVWALTRGGEVLASYVDADTGEHIAVKLRFRVEA